MPRDIPVGNGNLLVAFDDEYRLREFYFPYVGEENHIGGNKFRIGLMIDENFYWIDKSWDYSLNYFEDTLVTNVVFKKKEEEIEIRFVDTVDFHENIYIKKFTVINHSDKQKVIKIFFCQDFAILGNEIGDTGIYRPDKHVIIHYKNNRYFLVNISCSKVCGFSEYAIGTKHSDERGTWLDAEDGRLGMNPVQQGNVDSVLSRELIIDAGDSDTGYYWIAAGKSQKEVDIIDSVIREKGAENLIKRTLDYWKLWSRKEDIDFKDLNGRTKELYKRSLLVLRTQIDNRGAIIAANDSDVIQFNRDTYSYVWPRDGALTAHALDLASYPVLSNRFYKFCAEVIEEEGYLLHKYTSSKNVGSSWHPWVHNNRPQLPIQEDETSLVIWVLWKHFEKFKDIEFLKPLYKSLIKRGGKFIYDYIDEELGLPKQSYDLWEERLGIHLFTVASVYGGLKGTAYFTKIFGEEELAEKFDQRAKLLKDKTIEHMFDKEKNRFVRSLYIIKDDKFDKDYKLDASMYGIFEFGMFDAKDEKVKSTMKIMKEKLWCNTDVGGMARYEDDYYYKISDELPGNPWFITTMWLALYYIKSAESKDELLRAKKLIEWVEERTLDSGVLAEQVNPYSNEALSVSPLTWSHAMFINLILEYIYKAEELEN